LLANNARLSREEISTARPLLRKPRADRSTISLAYVSGDFRRHAVGHLIPGLLERHDRTRFEVIGVSFGPDDGSEVRARTARACDRFHDVAAKSDRDVAQMLQDMNVDIAIDLMGYTRGSRPAIFAYRPAPIQVSYLGFLGTMGAEFIDYIIADRVTIPMEQQPFYSEKIVHVPNCFMVNDDKQAIAGRTFSRRELGLPADGFIFCSFNNAYKLRASMFDIWMRLLRSISGSVLWLAQVNDAMVANLRNEATERGVDPSRLVFAPYMELSHNLARLRCADLFLDTVPYNAGATASNALWAGVPMITCIGDTFAGRMAASMLQAIGLQELVAASLQDYEALANKLATDPAALASVRKRLEHSRRVCPLFDTDRFRRHIEAAYTTMWKTHQRDEAPRSIAVEAIATFA
jgi:protein O-GlcNAc transferase